MSPLLRAASAVCCLTALAVGGPAFAQGPTNSRVAIIIDDLGHQRRLGERAVALPGPIAASVLPHTPHGRHLAARAHAAGKEVLLHLPMQASAERESAQGGITLEHSLLATRRIVAEAFASVPYATGINNHEGSLLTRHPGQMVWLMDVLRQYPGMFFVDSYTTHRSVALQVAREHDIPALRRDVFLDAVAETDAIEREFRRLKRIARERGFAVAIGHPLPETLSFLEANIGELRRQNFELVPLAALLPDALMQDPARYYGYASRGASR